MNYFFLLNPHPSLNHWQWQEVAWGDASNGITVAGGNAILSWPTARSGLAEGSWLGGIGGVDGCSASGVAGGVVGCCSGSGIAISDGK